MIDGIQRLDHDGSAVSQLCLFLPTGVRLVVKGVVYFIQLKTLRFHGHGNCLERSLILAS
jgi:hypothetical protein